MILGQALAYCARLQSVVGSCRDTFKNKQKKRNFTTGEIGASSLMTSFLSGYFQTRYHLIDNLILNKVSAGLYVNNRF